MRSQVRLAAAGLAALALVAALVAWPQLRGEALLPSDLALLGSAVLAAFLAGWAGARLGARRDAAALRESRDLLQTVLDTIPVRVFWKDAGLRYQGCNLPFALDAGLASPDELVGRDDFQMGWREQAELYRADDRKVIETGEARLGYEEPQTTPSGGRIWLRTSKVPLRGQDGRIRGVLGTYEDLTERVRVQQALRENEERSRILAEASFEGIAITSQGVLVDCSDRMAQMLGAATPGELVGRPVSDFIAPEHRELVAEAQRSGRLEPYEHQMRRVDGSPFPVEVRARAAEIGGRKMRITAIRDITERRRAERALRMFQFSIDQASDAVFWINRDGGFTYVNDQASLSLGYPREELLRLYLWDVDPVFPRELWFARWDGYQQDRRGGAEHLESIHRRKDGSTFPVEVVAKHLWLDDEELHVAVVRDIGERKRAEEALSRSEASLQLALEAARMGDWSWDIQTGEIAWSARCKALYGLPPETVVTYEKFLGCLHPDDRARVDAALRSAVAERSDYDVEKRAIWPDGSVHWNATRGRVFCDAAGEPVRVAGVTLDVTEAKRREASLRDANLIVENSQVMVFRWEARPGWPVVLASQNVRQLGYQPEELLSGAVPFASIVHPEDLERVGREVAEHTARAEDRFQQLYRVVTRAGEIRWVEDRTVIERDDAGRATHYHGIVEDVTARRQAAEERERLIAELELRNAELERFTYTVSHDLKSPLITMRGFLGYLEQDAVSGNLERLRADVSRLTDATDRMDRLLRELLELSRVGRVMNPPQRVPFGDVVQEALALVAGRLGAGGVQVEVSPGLPDVWGDRLRLIEVVQNLVDNAAKFMGGQPRPAIAIGVRDQPLDGRPVLFVRDNGVGIAPEYAERVFGLFEKLDPGSDGTGVGLALVKRIVEVHGGRIWLESAGEGLGATFCFTLPAAGAAGPGASPRPAGTPDGGGRP